MDRLDAILTDLDEPSRLAAALGRFLEVRPGARPPHAAGGPVERAAASSARAIDELRIVVSGDERDVPARAELARVLEAADRLAEAITEHIALLRLEPLRVDSLRALRRLCERSGQRRRALRAAAALAALGLTEPDDARAPRERAALGAGGERERHPCRVRRHHPPPDERHPATALLAAMSEVLPRLYGLALEDWGVTKSDRLAARSDDPVRALIGRVATCWASRRPSTSTWRARWRRGSRSRPARRRRCWCRRRCCRSRCRRRARSWAASWATCAPGRTASRASRARIWACWSWRACARSIPDYGRGVLPEEQLNDVAQKIARTLPRRQRRAFEQAALSFRDGGDVRGGALARRPAAHGPPRGVARVGRRAGRRSSRSCARTAGSPARATLGPTSCWPRRAPTSRSSR